MKPTKREAAAAELVLHHLSRAIHYAYFEGIESVFERRNDRMALHKLVFDVEKIVNKNREELKNDAKEEPCVTD